MAESVADWDRDQLHRDFQAIVGTPVRRTDAYQRAAERMTERVESGIEIAARLESAHRDSFSARINRDIFSYLSAGTDREGAWRAHVGPVDVIAPAQGAQFEAAEPRPETVGRIGFSSFYRTCWVILALALMVWGAMVGASLAGAALVGPITGATGTIGLVGLTMTLAVAGRRTRSQRVG